MTSIVLATGLAALAVAAPPTAAGVHSAAATVIVKLSNAQSTIKPSRVPVGPVVFTIVNNGRAARSFAIGGARTSTIAPGSSVTLRATFSQRGPHQYISIGRHLPRLSGVLTVFVPCTQPQVSTVDVRMDHGGSGITLS